MKRSNTNGCQGSARGEVCVLPGVLTLVIASVVCLAVPAVAEEASLLDGRCRVEVPEGWRADDSFGDDGLLLHPPDPRVWPVELVVWPIPDGGAETAKAAALAHEAAIRQNYPYSRKEQSEFRSATLEGLQISGQVKTPDGVIISCLFVAFASAGRYYTVGTFCLPDQVETVSAQYLQPVAENLAIGPPGNGTSSVRERPRTERPTPITPKPAPITPKPAAPTETKPDTGTTGTVSEPHVPRPGETEIRDHERVTETVVPPAVAEAREPVVTPGYDDRASELVTRPGGAARVTEPRPARTTTPAGTVTSDRQIAPPPEPVRKSDEQPVIAPPPEPVRKSDEQPVIAPTPEPVRKSDEQPVIAPTARPPVPPVDERAPTVLPATPVTERPDHETVPPTTKPVVGPAQAVLQSVRTAHLELDAPPEYAIDVVDGKWLVRPGGREGERIGLLVWPLVRYDRNSSAPQVARAALQHWPVSANQFFEFRTQADGKSAVFFGNGVTGSGPVRLLGSITSRGNVALLSALYVAPEDAAAEWPALVRMLASVEVSALPIRAPLQAPPSYEWEMPGYPGLTMPMPEGWLVRGRVTNEGDTWALCVEAATRGSQRYYMSWQQPLKPLFHDLTPVLEAAGWKRLDRYSNQPDGQTHVLLSKTGPGEFVEKYWNNKTRVPIDNVEVIRQQERGVLRGLLNSPDGDGLQMVVAGESVVGARHNHYLVAVGDAEQGGQQVWQAAVFEASGPAEYPDHAVAALRNMIQGASVPAGQEAGDVALRVMIQRAKEAVTLLPSVVSDRMRGIESALNLLSDDETETWRPPAASGQIWKQLTAPGVKATDAENIVPEIGKLRE